MNVCTEEAASLSPRSKYDCGVGISMQCLLSLYSLVVLAVAD